MERFPFQQKAISSALLVMFLVFMNPKAAAGTASGSDVFPCRASVEADTDVSGPEFVEKREPEKKIRAKRFPWVPVIGLLLAGGAAALYFLVLKEDDEEGFSDDFTGSASPLWRPRTPSLWSVSGDAYQCFSSTYNYSEYNYVDRTFRSDNLAIEARLRQTMGDIGQYHAVFFVTGTTMTSVSGFEFRIFTNMHSQGAFSIVRYDNANLTAIQPAGASIAAYAHNAAIGGDLSWNTLRIVRRGSEYSFYCNGVLLHSFSEASLDPAVAGIRLFSDADPHRLLCDFFRIQP